jgi:hypothetical protein
VTRFLTLISIALADVCLGWGFISSDYGFALLAVAALSGLWVFAESRAWTWGSDLGFAAMIAAAAGGIALHFSPGWMIAAVLFALAAWDLSHFNARSRFVGSETFFPILERRHFMRLGLVFILTIVLSLLTLQWRVQIRFEIAVLLVLVTVGGMTYLFAWLWGNRTNSGGG